MAKSTTIKEPVIEDGQRLQTVLDVLHISGNKLATLLKYKAASSVYHVLEGRNKLSPEMIERIIKKFPEVSYIYLNTGNGSPLLSSESERVAQQNVFRHIYNGSKSQSTGEQPPNPVTSSLEYGVPQQLQAMIENSRRTNLLLVEMIAEIKELTKAVGKK